MTGPGMTLTVEQYHDLPAPLRTEIDQHLDRHGNPKGRVYRIDRLGNRWLIHTFATPIRTAGRGMPPLRDASVLIPAGPRWPR